MSVSELEASEISATKVQPHIWVYFSILFPGLTASP